MSKELMIGGVNLFDALKDIGFEEVDEDTNNDFIPPFLVREVVEWSHIQKLSQDELRAYLIEKHVLEKESIIYNTLLNKDKEFIILYGYEYDPFYIVATIISSDNSYNHVSIAAMERQDGSLFILDISVRNKDVNKGYGTILMEQLKANAMQHNKKQITGDLTPEDLSHHGERLVHFYKKHGFEIEEFGNYAKIKWVNSNLIEGSNDSMEDKKFRNVETGKMYLASEMGKIIFEEAWKEQKEAGVIPEDSSDFEEPKILSKNDYIEIGLDFFKDNDEDYEEF